ncbi:MAG: hypothetical protein J6T22_13775, partial [Bacteroidales bacterium]|nr:hypothetical protein [Bacteroidales bacterium]
EKFTWYSLCLATIGCLVAGLVSNSVKVLLFCLPLLLYLCILEYKHLNRRLILNKDGFTDENGSFYAWKSIDHCYIKDYYRNFVIIFKDKDQPNISVSLGNYFFKNRELEDAVNRLAGKSLIRYTYEDKKAEKEDNKAAMRLLLKFFLIVIGVLLLIALFSFYYSRIDR